MGKQHFEKNPKVTAIFDDLEKYCDFCKDFGYKINESDLYDNKSYVYRQYLKFTTGKQAKDNWADLIASTPR